MFALKVISLLLNTPKVFTQNFAKKGEWVHLHMCLSLEIACHWGLNKLCDDHRRMRQGGKYWFELWWAHPMVTQWPRPWSASGTCDLILTRIIKGVACLSWLFCCIRFHWSRWQRGTLPLARKKQIVMLWTAYGEGHVAGNCGLPPAHSQQNPEPSSVLQLQGNEFCQPPKWAWKQIHPQLNTPEWHD